MNRQEKLRQRRLANERRLLKRRGVHTEDEESVVEETDNDTSEVYKKPIDVGQIIKLLVMIGVFILLVSMVAKQMEKDEAISEPVVEKMEYVVNNTVVGTTPLHEAISPSLISITRMITSPLALFIIFPLLLYFLIKRTSRGLI